MATVKPIVQPYKKAENQPGWGIGYGSSNVGGGFNQFDNYDALQGEIGRINSVIGNRTQQGMGNGAQQNYLNMLNTKFQPFQQQQQNVTNAQNSYNESQQKIDANKWNNASIDDIAKKYGFDYSRDYAKQQAEAEAQALRNANLDAQRRNESNRKVGTQNIDNNLMNMAEGLDRNYFQKMLGQQQNQVESGMNAGIASDQDLRLQMNRQAEMGASYRDANLGKMKLDEDFNLNDLKYAEAMGLINQQSLAREDSLYNDRLQQGFGNLMDERSMVNQLDQQMWGRSQAEIDRALQQQSELRQSGQWQTQFDWGKQMDTAGLTGMFNGDRTLQGQQFDWGKLVDEAGLTGLFKGDRTLQGQQFDWSKVVDQHGMSMDDKRFALQQQQAQQAAAQRSMSRSGSGSGSKSSGSGGSSSKPSAKPSKLGSQFLKESGNVPQTAADRVWLQADQEYQRGLDIIKKNTGKEAPARTKKVLQDVIYGKAQKDAQHRNNLGIIGKYLK